MRLSEAEVEAVCTCPPLCQSVLSKNAHQRQHFPSCLAKAPLDLCLGRATAAAGLIWKFNDPVMEPKGIVFFGLIIGIAGSLDGACDNERQKEKKVQFHEAEDAPGRSVMQ